MGISEARDPEVDEIKRDVAPEAVLDEIGAADREPK
jgi:hypothetical protein